MRLGRYRLRNNRLLLIMEKQTRYKIEAVIILLTAFIITAIMQNI